MKKIKLCAMILCLSVFLGCFISCDQLGGGNGKQTDKYVATVTTRFATNDDGMKAAIDAAGSTSSTVSVDGDSVMIESESTLGDISLKNSYICVDGILYHNKTVTVSGKAISTYEKAGLSTEDRDGLFASAGAGAEISTDDFGSVSKSESGNRITYNCEDIKDDSKASLCALIAGRLSALGSEVTLSSVSYTEEQLDERIVSSVLSCDFVIVIEGETYEVTMRTYQDYNYEAEVNITAPADVDKYTEVSAKDIVG